MAFSVFVMFSQDFVNAAPRKKASVKRAGNTKKAKSSSSSASHSNSAKSKTKRAATTNASTKRAGTTRANTARVQSRVKGRVSQTNKKSSQSDVAQTDKSEEEVSSVEAQKVEEDSTVAETVKQEVEEDDPVALAKLRIKKVEGSADDYTCIDGWTNHWTFFLPENGDECRYMIIKNNLIMDKNGVIKNVADRNAYGKNKKGCPIKLDKFEMYWYFDHVEPFGQLGSSTDAYKKCMEKHSDIVKNKLIYIRWNMADINLSCEICSFGRLPREPKFGVLKTKMTIKEIDNTGVKGWTEEEYKAWNGYRPILGYYFDDFSLFEGKTKVDDCKGKDDSYYRLGISKDLEKKFLKGNLFTYWD